MRTIRCLVLVVAMGAMASSPQALPADNKNGKNELLTLYLLAIAADRCGFPLTVKQADKIDRDTKALIDSLKLRQRESDAIYSEADIKFEQQGAAACDRSSNFAKGFRRTLQRVIGP